MSKTPIDKLDVLTHRVEMHLDRADAKQHQEAAISRLRYPFGCSWLTRIYDFLLTGDPAVFVHTDGEPGRADPQCLTERGFCHLPECPSERWTA